MSPQQLIYCCLQANTPAHFSQGLLLNQLWSFVFIPLFPLLCHLKKTKQNTFFKTAGIPF